MGIRLLDLHEVAQRLAFSEGKVRQLARTGDLPAVKIGMEWRFPEAALDDWIESKRYVLAREA